MRCLNSSSPVVLSRFIQKWAEKQGHINTAST